ncbi:MAG: DUF4145 domain-containing protein [Deltaproteobacteria bacterium]
MEKTPNYKSDNFQCPHCQVVAQQQWFDSSSADSIVIGIIRHIFLDYRTGIQSYQQEAIAAFVNTIERHLIGNIRRLIPDKFAVATCSSCNDISLWVGKELVYPRKTLLPQPNSDIDENIKTLYQEAATIFMDSPKGATALLRFALQMLLKQVGKSGKNINNDIKELVSEGLSPKIQQALDLLRVVGNNAVHPGQIDIDDNSEIALKLFNVLNFIADEMITKPKELATLYSNILPEETKEHIKQRDENK